MPTTTPAWSDLKSSPASAAAEKHESRLLRVCGADGGEFLPSQVHSIRQVVPRRLLDPVGSDAVVGHVVGRPLVLAVATDEFGVDDDQRVGQFLARERRRPVGDAFDDGFVDGRLARGGREVWR